LKTYEKINYDKAIKEKIAAINTKILDLNPTSIDAVKTKELIKTLQHNPAFAVSIDVLEAELKTKYKN